jgi:hypothetical protein
MFKWPVLTQDEILEQQKPIEPGDYKFRVDAAQFGISSKTRNPQIALTLTILGPNGKEPTCFDYLIGTSEMAWKTKKFWQSVGNPEMYESGECSEQDFIGKCGIAKIRLVKSEDGEKLFVKIVNYLPFEGIEMGSSKQIIQKENQSNSSDIELNDDDIPF